MDRHFNGIDRNGAMKELDAKDRDILGILSKEARIPLKTLAGRIGLSRSATSERVAALEKSGVIRGYRADIGQMDSNLVSAFLMVTLVSTPSMGVLDQLARYSEVRRVSSVTGQLDLMVEVEVPSIDRLNTLRDIIATHPSVQDLTTLIVLRRDIERLE
jgi:DNA-binding Lrp family transcriptional regulator